MKKKRLFETSENKEKRNRQNKEYMKKKRLCENSKNKEKRNRQNKEYMKKKRSGNECMQNLIINFHDAVSKGPLYICSCCDQMWYKHSVSGDTQHSGKTILTLRDIYKIKQVLMMLNGCVNHVKIT